MDFVKFVGCQGLPPFWIFFTKLNKSAVCLVTVMTSKVDQITKIDTRSKFKMPAADILKSVKRPFLNGFAPNLTQWPKMRSRNWLYRQTWYPAKSKMAAAARLKITFLAISRRLLHIFARNLIHRQKTGSRSQFYVIIHIVQKSKMAATAILKSVKRP